MLTETIETYRLRVEVLLAQQLQSRRGSSLDSRLQDAMEYSLLNGGKRLRPTLVYLSNQLCGGHADAADMAAAAIEAIHSYSLVHDDLPAMDDDDLRRGKPTCHIKYDEATAILVGDALLTWAFELLSSSGCSAEQVLAMIRCMAQTSGDLGMVGGQNFDLRSTGKPLSLEELQQMHRAKTGALINASLTLGALSANATEQQISALIAYGDAIGLAFQIKDDLLDIESDTQTLGKPQGSDLEKNKATYPALIGVEESRLWLAKLRDQAIQSLAIFGDEAAKPLTELAHYITERNN